MRASRHYALIIGLTLVYLLAGRAGLALLSASCIRARQRFGCPPGLRLRRCCYSVYGLRPPIFTGAFLVNATTAGSLLTSFGVAAGNTLEGVALRTLSRRSRTAPRLSTVRPTSSVRGSRVPPGRR